MSERGDFGHHRTVTGKVVYRRKPHVFTTNDAKRILRGIFLAHDLQVLSAQEEFELDWVEIAAYLFQVIATQYGVNLALGPLRLALRRSITSATALDELLITLTNVGMPTPS